MRFTLSQEFVTKVADFAVSVQQKTSEPVPHNAVNGANGGGAENASFEPVLYFKRSFYQDRLGTNIGKVQKREMRCSACMQVTCRVGCLRGLIRTRWPLGLRCVLMPR